MPLINKVNQLNERVTFYGTKYVPDKIGNQIETEVELFSCWAQIRTDFMNSEYVARQTLYPNAIEIVIRYDQPGDVTKAIKVHWRDKTLTVNKISQDTAYKQWSTVIAAEEVSDKNKRGS